MGKDKVSLNLNSNNYGVIIGEAKEENAKTALFESFRNNKQNANMCVLGVPGEGMSFNKKIDLANCSFINSFEIMDSKTNKYNKLVHKAQKLLNEKKYKKAY